jgi:hypothetical protein
LRDWICLHSEDGFLFFLARAVPLPLEGLGWLCLFSSRGLFDTGIFGVISVFLASDSGVLTSSQSDCVGMNEIVAVNRL